MALQERSDSAKLCSGGTLSCVGIVSRCSLSDRCRAHWCIDGVVHEAALVLLTGNKRTLLAEFIFELVLAL